VEVTEEPCIVGEPTVTEHARMLYQISQPLITYVRWLKSRRTSTKMASIDVLVSRIASKLKEGNYKSVICVASSEDSVAACPRCIYLIINIEALKKKHPAPSKP
jgi:hypothetical protein